MEINRKVQLSAPRRSLSWVTVHPASAVQREVMISCISAAVFWTDTEIASTGMQWGQVEAAFYRDALRQPCELLAVTLTKIMCGSTC